MAMKKFGVKEVMDVTLYDTTSKRPVLHLDTLKITSIDNKGEQVSAQGGKGNAKLVTWDFNRTAEMQIQDALLSPKSFELLSGNKVTVGKATVYVRQDTAWESKDGVMVDKGEDFPLVATASGAIELAFTPKEVASDILVYDADDDGGTPLTAGTLTGKTLTNVAWANKKLVAYYTRETSNKSETYTISADKFPSTYKLVGDTVIRNATTQKDEAFQVVINNLKFKPDFKFEFKADGDPTPFDMNAEILREANSPRMIQMIQYDFNTTV